MLSLVSNCRFATQPACFWLEDASRPGHRADRLRQPGAFLDETPTAIMISQLFGVISEFEKASLVAKLRGARQSKKAATGKCEGRHRRTAPRCRRSGACATSPEAEADAARDLG
jgi:hypothetical protein